MNTFSGLGGIGGIGGLSSLAPPPIPAGLPPAPVQHVHHHVYENDYKKAVVLPQPQIISSSYNAPPPPPPPVYNAPPTYSQPPAYNPPPPRPAYSNPTPVYNPVPARPYSGQQSAQSYGNTLAPRDQCVCVPVEQCPSYDVIGRVADYAIDPRSKLNSTIVADEDDIVIVKQAEGRSVDKTRRRRQSHLRQTIVGDDSITVVSSDSSATNNPIGGGGVVGPIAPPAADFDPTAENGPVTTINNPVSGVSPGDNVVTSDGASPIAVGVATGVATGVAVSFIKPISIFFE